VEDSTVQGVVDRLERVLKGQDNIDEVRVALTADDLPGTLDVSVEDQTGDVAITLDGETVTVSVDSLPSVDISSQSAGIATESTLDAIKVAAQALDDALASSGTDEIRVTSPSPLDVSGATVTVTDDGALTLAANDGIDIGDVGIEDISPVTGQATKSGSLPVTLASDEDTVSVQEDTALDASAAEIDVNLNSQSLQNVSVDLASDSLANPIDVDIASASAEPIDVSGATVPTEQQSPVKIEDSGGAAIDPATEQKLESVRALLDRLEDALTSVGSDEVRTTIENGASPVAFPDTGRRTVSTAGSPEALVSAPAPVASGVEVKALPSNAGTAFIFISGESKADSYPLAPGDEVFMPVDDASKVLADVNTGGDTVAFIAA
jgi:hypothetical protein